MKVSLITTVYNEADNILLFLHSYNKQTKYADEFIIVDGGSTDDTVSIIEQFSLKNSSLNIKVIVDKTCSKKYVAGPIAKGRNVAIKNSKYDYIAVTDAGCLLDSRWFEEIVKPFEDENVDVVSGWYEVNVTNNFQAIYKDIFLRKLETLDLETFLPSSRSIAFKKSCWKIVGMYPTGTLTAEDTLFDLNMKRENCIFFFASKAVVYWDCPKDYNEAIEKVRYYAFGDGQNKLFIKKFLLRNLLLFIPINILLSKKRRSNFKLSYMHMFNYQKYYVKGLLL